MSRDYTPSDLEDSRYVENSTSGGASDRQMERPDRTHSSACHSRVDNHASPSPDEHTIPARCHDSRSAYYTCSRAYRLRGSEIQTLAELGKFRAVGTAHLARHAYQGQHEDMQEDIRNLDQVAYYGFVKPKEANHDAGIYRLYQKEIIKILDQGGRNPRAVLDFELKKNPLSARK